MTIRVRDFVERVDTTPLSELADRAPWDWTNSSDAIIRALLSACGPEFRIADGVALHASAIIETGAQIKPPAIIGADCFISATALVRGGCWLDRACIIGCGVMTGVGAVVRKARLEAGASVAVIGCGAVGLNAVQGARLAGAGRIIAVDVDSAHLERARQFGATHVVDGSSPDAVQAVKALTEGRGADCVIEAAGRPAGFRLAVEAVRPGGQVVWLGKVNADQEVTFRWGSLMGERRIVRSSYGDAKPRRDFPWLVGEYLAGRLLLDELITRRIALDEINEGFACLARGEGIRTVVMFD